MGYELICSLTEVTANMQSFTKSIAIDYKFKPEFHFSRIYTISKVRYHVAVKDFNSQSFAFNMEERNGNWQIIDAPKLPD